MATNGEPPRPERPRWDDESPPVKPGRTEHERDRDRLLYASSLRRLAGVTQVASPELGHVLHNRLTHSLKVAQIARRMTERLQRGQAEGLLDVDGLPEGARRRVAELNPDAVEAAALGHDLGHPPFGHIAEDELDDYFDAYGGFNGNAQSFRIVVSLAMRDEERRGLNLTRETLHGVLKYPNERRERGDKFGVYATEREVFMWVRHGTIVRGRTLSAEIVNWADDVTYAVHDLEDFYRAGLIPLDRLGQDPAERQRFVRSFAQTDGQPGLTRRLEKELTEDLEAADRTAAVLETALDRLLTGGLGDLQPYRGTEPQRAALTQRASVLLGDFLGALSPYVSADRVEDTERVVEIDPRQRAEVTVLKELIWFYVVDRHELATLQAGQRGLIKTLCSAFGQAARDNHLRLFPEPVREQLEGRDERARMRGTRDYIASLTEAKGYELYHRLTGTARTTLLDIIPG